MNIPHMLYSIAAMLWAAATNADATLADPRVQLAMQPEPTKDFTLIDANDRPFRFSGTHGRDVLVFFGFTHCASVCPAAMLKLKLLTGYYEEQGIEALPVILISVDGDRDTPVVLKKYLAGFPPNFIGLTGNPKAVRDIAAQFKAVFFKGLPYDNAGNYQVEHTSMIYLVDAEGRLRATFIDAPVEAMAETTRRLTARLDKAPGL